jgi:hypothetical protein
MTPFIFTSAHRSRVHLRDFIIDLNQEKKFDEIVDFVENRIEECRTKGKTNDHRLIALMGEVHSKKELREIISVNLKRLQISFSEGGEAAINGASEDQSWWDRFWDWLRGNDQQDGKDGEGEDEDGQSLEPDTHTGVGSGTASQKDEHGMSMWDYANEDVK